MEFGEIYTKQLNSNGYIGAKMKGRVLQIMGNLPFELATLGTGQDPTAPQANVLQVGWIIGTVLFGTQALCNTNFATKLLPF